MIKTLTAYTSELDDERIAIEELKSQLNLEDGLLKNTIGIVACHYEFVLSGIFKEICDELPFEVVGTIASAQSVSGQADSLLLALTVMTSDDVEFDTIITTSLLTEPCKAIADSYKAGCRSEKPALILTFASFILQNCGDDYVDALTEVSGGVPCFGTQAIDETEDFSNCFMLTSGEHHLDKMAMVLIYGNIKPKFYIAHMSKSRIIDKSAVITKSAGAVIMEVNDRPIVDFLEDLGLVKAAETRYAMSNLPLLLDYNDGSPKVSKILIMLSPEKYAICAGAVPEGSTLQVALADKEDVMLTAKDLTNEIQKDVENASLLLAYSCICRYMTLGSEQCQEMDFIQQNISGVPIMMANSGGEICPTQVSDGKAVNRFHNNALVACLI